jgi:hypothetical protein
MEKFNSQICTTREQSERLLALGLKKETADMVWVEAGYGDDEYLLRPLRPNCFTDIPQIPAWSLHRLLLLIPKEVNIDGYRFPLRSDAVMRLDEADDMYEYVIGVLERTIKEGYFNKEYLQEQADSRREE